MSGLSKWRYRDYFGCAGNKRWPKSAPAVLQFHQHLISLLGCFNLKSHRKPNIKWFSSLVKNYLICFADVAQVKLNDPLQKWNFRYYKKWKEVLISSIRCADGDYPNYRWRQRVKAISCLCEHCFRISDGYGNFCLLRYTAFRNFYLYRRFFQ